MKQAIKNVLLSIFGNGNISMMRVLTFFVVINIMVMWDIECVRQGAFVDMGWNNATVLLGCLGIKAFQRFAEGNPPAEGESK